MVKKDAKIINKIFEHENNFKFYNITEALSLISGFFCSSFFVFLIATNETVLSTEKNIAFLLLLCFILSFVAFGFISYLVLYLVNKIIKRKHLKKEIKGLDVSDSSFFVSRKKVEFFYNLYNSLSKKGKYNLYYINSYIKKENDLNKIEKKCLYNEIGIMSTKDFINYWNTSFKEDAEAINIDIEYAIEHKLKNILKNINESEFNEYKNEIIKITETLKSKKTQLAIFEKIEELKEKYDEEVISNKINIIKNKVTKPKQERLNNKVLKSI